ncbi:hypothetical protein [Parachitinimonas caeni]|uniref:Uncharacterized protein n=1 Tax=Parachitinimonas caeni TaxID=3031301 RepID=A0ABT7DW34_9NEIS|nr:hypothetical protein [Parachitinimonas caeni]MDK2124276.1 hypothetical protein [Parachitinimonas caeni]
MRQLLIASLTSAALLAIPAHAAKKQPAAAPAAQPAKAPQIEMSLKDMTPLFIDFYDAATTPVVVPSPPAAPKPPATASAPAPTPAPPAAPVKAMPNAEQRFNAWKKYYNFTVQENDEALRKELDAKFDRYAAVMKQIEGGYDTMEPKPDALNTALAAQYLPEKGMSIGFVTYVGLFEGKVMSKIEEGKQKIYLPLEVTPEQRALPLARILADNMQNTIVAWPNGNPRNLAEWVVAEGVKAHVLQNVVPGKTQAEYMDVPADWLANAQGKQADIFKEMVPLLKDSGATIETYRKDKLNEARLAGWVAVEAFLKKKARLADMIRQSPADIIRLTDMALLRGAVQANKKK